MKTRWLTTPEDLIAQMDRSAFRVAVEAVRAQQQAEHRAAYRAKLKARIAGKKAA